MKLSKQAVLKSIGEKIKIARRKQEISQEKLAEFIGIHRTYMGRIERGISNPPIYTIYRVIKALKTKSSEILPF